MSGVWDYEGNVILGVYTTEEGARAKKKEAEEEKQYDLVTVNVAVRDILKELE